MSTLSEMGENLRAVVYSFRGNSLQENITGNPQGRYLTFYLYGTDKQDKPYITNAARRTVAAMFPEYRIRDIYAVACCVRRKQREKGRKA